MVGNRYSKSTFGASNCFVNNHFRDELQYECYFLFLLKSLYSSCLFSWCTVYIVHTSALKSSANCFILLFPRISPFCIFWGKWSQSINWRQDISLQFAWQPFHLGGTDLSQWFDIGLRPLRARCCIGKNRGVRWCIGENIAKGTTDPRVEFFLSNQLLLVIWQVFTQTLIKHLQNLDQAPTSKS